MLLHPPGTVILLKLQEVPISFEVCLKYMILSCIRPIGPCYWYLFRPLRHLPRNPAVSQNSRPLLAVRERRARLMTCAIVSHHGTRFTSIFSCKLLQRLLIGSY